MKKYRVVTHFEEQYTHEVHIKTERTTDLKAAIGAYIIYIEHPEVVFCSVDIPDDNDMPKKIIALFSIK